MLTRFRCATTAAKGGGERRRTWAAAPGGGARSAATTGITDQISGQSAEDAASEYLHGGKCTLL